MSAVEQTGTICIVDLAPRWTIDAVLFLAVSAALLAWSIAVTSARASAVTFVVAVVAAVVADRVVSSLTDPAKIADQSLEQPIGAYHESMARYLATAVLILAIFVGVSLAFALALGSAPDGAAPLAGVSAAIGISRLIGVRRLRRLERERHIRLSAGAGMVWRGPRTYYARPDLGI